MSACTQDKPLTVPCLAMQVGRAAVMAGRYDTTYSATFGVVLDASVPGAHDAAPELREELLSLLQARSKKHLEAERRAMETRVEAFRAKQLQLLEEQRLRSVADEDRLFRYAGRTTRACATGHSRPSQWSWRGQHGTHCVLCNTFSAGGTQLHGGSAERSGGSHGGPPGVTFRPDAQEGGWANPPCGCCEGAVAPG